MMRVAAIVTLATVMYSATAWAGLVQTSRATDSETGSGVRMPLQSGSLSTERDQGEVLVEVRRGDHIWSISERHLESFDPTREVAPYWRLVVETNTARIKSGDPDLIYPGEEILLPALTEQP